MSRLSVKWAAASAMILALCAAGCVVPGDAGYGDVGVGYGVNFYEPFDNYGYEGPGYLVGPPRGGDRRLPGYRPGAHAYRGAPAGHAMPSIPHGGPRDHR
ncbi:MAG: hypothetical protein WB440_06990 [Steroidobacteraceae bacterium]|jgi:hypothetical protein